MFFTAKIHIMTIVNVNIALVRRLSFWQSKILFLVIENNIRLYEKLFAIAAYLVCKLHAFFRLIILGLTRLFNICDVKLKS